jgi:hypothetical protein
VGGDTNDTPRRPSAADWTQRFLRALERCGCIVHAARAARVKRRRVYRRRDQDARFAARMAVALDRAMDRAEGELFRRAVRGVLRKKFTGKGEPVNDPATGEQYVEREFSDRLLALLLQAHRPKYRPVVKNELSGPGGGPIRSAEAEEIDLSKLTDDELEMLRDLYHRAGERSRPPAVAGGD